MLHKHKDLRLDPWPPWEKLSVGGDGVAIVEAGGCPELTATQSIPSVSSRLGERHYHNRRQDAPGKAPMVSL